MCMNEDEYVQKKIGPTVGPYTLQLETLYLFNKRNRAIYTENFRRQTLETITRRELINDDRTQTDITAYCK